MADHGIGGGEDEQRRLGKEGRDRGVTVRLEEFVPT
jgi:hypothetical protein